MAEQQGKPGMQGVFGILLVVGGIFLVIIVLKDLSGQTPQVFPDTSPIAKVPGGKVVQNYAVNQLGVGVNTTTSQIAARTTGQPGPFGYPSQINPITSQAAQTISGQPGPQGYATQSTGILQQLKSLLGL